METFSLIKSDFNKNNIFVIAEIGQNHQGDIEIAKDMIRRAKKCGADCVKFQKTSLPDKFNRKAMERPYGSENSWGSTYGEHKSFLEFSEHQFVQLQKYAEEIIGIRFTASAMDETSLMFLKSLNVPFVKIGSGDSNNFPLIEKAARLHTPLIISTGMINFEGVKKIYDILSKHHENFCLMHCVSSYPTPIEEINLNVLKTYQKEFPRILIGYSGHELGVDISVYAVALGAKIIERHFTLDKTQKGSDHACSLTPEEFKEMVTKIRLLKSALGVEDKFVQTSEKNCYNKLGKTLVTARALKKGHVLREEDLKVKVAEPKGIDGLLFYEILGKRLNISLSADESIFQEHLN